MSLIIAVVGPRKGADLDAVEAFMLSLHESHPEAIVVSGGAEGVDTTAEQAWLRVGGQVWSYRIKKKADEEFVCEKWELGGENPRVFELISEPTWADPVSALHYRSMLVAEVADKVCAFEGIDRMRGTDFTIYISQAEGNPTYVWRDGAWVE